MVEVFDPFDWRREPCLGCGETVKRNRDAWIEMGGTHSGSWAIAMGVEAYLMWSDPLPPPPGEELYILGVSHRSCLDLARSRHRDGQITPSSNAPVLTLDQSEFDASDLRPDLPVRVGACPFCQLSRSKLTEEDVFPLWLLRDLHRRGFRNSPTDNRPLRGPKTPVCADCNNGWMSVIENDTSQLILSLFDSAQTIDSVAQEKLARWAALKALVIDAASTRLLPRGFGHDLKIQREPHQGIFVWIAAYGDRDQPLKAVSWIVYKPESEELLAVCYTFTAFRLAFQVLVPLLAGDLSPLETFNNSVEQIFPPKESDIAWPPPFQFDGKSLEALACRVYDNREPVEIRVTLQRTIIRRAE